MISFIFMNIYFCGYAEIEMFVGIQRIKMNSQCIGFMSNNSNLALENCESPQMQSSR